jgi:hypothetical protein
LSVSIAMIELGSFLSHHADEITALATVACAVFALVTSAVSIFVAAQALLDQRRHNLLSIKPFPNIATLKYLNLIGITIRNDGVGPLIIKKLVVWRGDETEENPTSTKSDVISLMEEDKSFKKVEFKDYRRNVAEGTCVKPGDEFPLIKLSGDHKDAEFCKQRDDCLRILSKLALKLEYTDVGWTPQGKRVDPSVFTLKQHFKGLEPDEPPQDESPKKQSYVIQTGS